MPATHLAELPDWDRYQAGNDTSLQKRDSVGAFLFSVYQIHKIAEWG